MADDREVYSILENSSGIGQPLIAKKTGDAPSTDNGLLAFSWRDSAGNVILPQLTAAGKVPVDTEAVPGVCISGQAQSVAGGLTFQDVVTLVLALLKDYTSLEFSASCSHLTLWEIVYIDDVGGTPTETKIASFLTGPGQFTCKVNLDCGDFDTQSGTLVQNLVLRGKNVRHASDLHGYLGIVER